MKNLVFGLSMAASLIACSDNTAAASQGTTNNGHEMPADVPGEATAVGTPLSAAIASSIVRAYSKTIACQIEIAEYRAVEIRSGDPDDGGLGALFLVVWEGDTGCMAGNATVLPNFTLVEHRGFSTADPIVVTDYEFPDIYLRVVEDLSVKDGLIRISGFEVGEDDSMTNPTQKAIYKVRFDGEKFSKVD